MAKVRMLQQMSGYRNGEPWPVVGEEMFVSDEEAASLTSGQTPIAELVEERAVKAEDPKVETATVKPATSTTKPAARPSAAKAK